MKKRVHSLLKGSLAAGALAGILVNSFPVFAAESSQSIKVQADGNSLVGQVVEGTTVISARTLAEALGRTVTWNPNDQTVTIESRLDRIMKRGYIRIGTTGDYKPFSYLNPQTGEYEGFDIEAAKKLGKDLGVEVKWVKTTWKTLVNDLLDDKFDMAMGGITQTLEREKKAHLSSPYLDFGKSPLIRMADKEKYKSLEDIDQPNIKIGVNPGGTNEKFVRANIKKAQIIMVENNLEIPKMIADGKVDVMITDSVEAIRYAKDDSRLYAALTDHTFTKNQMGYLMPRGDQIFEDWVNLWMDEMILKGEFKQLEKKWM